MAKKRHNRTDGTTENAREDTRDDTEKRAMIQAIVIAILGWTGFSISDTSIKLLSDDYALSWILTINGALGFLIALIWLLTVYGTRGFHSTKWKLHILRGIMVTGVSFFVVHSVSRLPLADFYCFIFTTPILTAFFSIIFLKEELYFHRILAVLAGFVGVIILAGPQMSTFNIGVLAAVAGAICLSLSALVARKIGHQDPLPLYTLLPSLFIFLFNAPSALATGMPTPDMNALLFLLAAPMILLGQIAFCQAFARAPRASVLAPFHYIQLIWGILIGYFLFHEVPTVATWTGTIIIVTAGFFLLYKERRTERLTRTER